MSLRLHRVISDYVRLRIEPALPPREAMALRDYFLGLAKDRRWPARNGSGFDYQAIAEATSIPLASLLNVKGILRPLLDAIVRELPRAASAKPKLAARKVSRRLAAPKAKPARKPKKRSAAKSDTARPQSAAERVARKLGRQRKDTVSILGPKDPATTTKRRGPLPAPFVEFPTPLWEDTRSFADFHRELDRQARRHGDNNSMLQRALATAGIVVNVFTVRNWRKGIRYPRTVRSMQALAAIERRYRLPAGHLSGRLPHPARAVTGNNVLGLSHAEHRRLAWHLPDDFSTRPAKEQEEILAWVREVVIRGSTSYRAYQAAALRTPFALRLPEALAVVDARWKSQAARRQDNHANDAAMLASPNLDREMADLVAFKMATLTPYGYQRSGIWGREAALQQVEHLGLLFGAMAAPAAGPVAGLGADKECLCLALLAFPQAWGWYVDWRERRRGFFTTWESNALSVAAALARPETGWLWQNPALGRRLRPIPGLLAQQDIDRALADWTGACQAAHRYAVSRGKEVKRVAKVHRDPFEPILPVLEADSPLTEYKKIADEIIRLMPNAERYPVAAAEATRALLMIRLGLHLGVRQKNLRQLLARPKGTLPSSARQLSDLRRGELRWNSREAGWEVFIPMEAFKNAGSSYFRGQAFHLRLPDLQGLYDLIDGYLERDRPLLLGNAADPGTFFVKTAKQTSASAEYDQNTFYEAWRLTIQRYGIYNPYTGRGAIKGLLPHGPHNVRDVLATHILKKTGSYEQASYAIQDSPETVQEHYGRFLPGDKAAMAARVLNEVWEAA
ncbi:hypothetical protein CHU95_01140 [Niveispirillum lacus]|uniref:Uncharacterized protein n=1 Tax=Niveispirillum lacus TaxID=1981099 RepID=A0A255Z7W6_9PROT|nr:hypothetical protein [Niveispirillum lacus]OYQ37522.1 hypothetical protein CHU95_01140 [Niveispirillum lacus]